MEGLLDFIKTPEGQGLLAMAAGGAMGARRGTPWNNAGRALSAGLAGYAGAGELATKNAQELEAKKLRDMQVQTAQMALDKGKGEATWMAGLPEVMAPTTQGTTEQGRMLAAQNEGFGQEGFNALQASGQYAQQGKPQTAPLGVGFGADPQRMKNYAMQPGSPVLGDILKAQFAPKENKQQLISSYNPVTKQMEQRFVSQDTQGVVGFGQPTEVKPRANEDVHLGGGKWQNMGFTPETGKFDAPIGQPFDKRPTASNISVSGDKNITTQESEQSKAHGKGLGEMRTEIQNQGFKAPGSLARLTRMEQLLGGLDGGKLSGIGQQASSVAQSFGVKLDPRLGDKEAAASLAIEMALSMKGPTTGPMTDKDFDNFLNTVPRLATSPEGRAQITATLRAKLQRDIKIAGMARDYAKSNRNVISDEFMGQVADYVAKNPLYVTGNSVIDQADAILRGGK